MQSLLKPARAGQSSAIASFPPRSPLDPSPSPPPADVPPASCPSGQVPFQSLRGGSVLRTIADEVRRFGVEVRLRRIALGLRQADVASRAHLSPNHLGAIETGRGGVDPSLGVAISIARGMGTNLQDRLGGFKGLTPLGLEAGRLSDALPAHVQSSAVALLRALERQARGASPGAERGSALSAAHTSSVPRP